jgi:hypothetical protein
VGRHRDVVYSLLLRAQNELASLLYLRLRGRDATLAQPLLEPAEVDVQKYHAEECDAHGPSQLLAGVYNLRGRPLIIGRHRAQSRRVVDRQHDPEPDTLQYQPRHQRDQRLGWERTSYNHERLRGQSSFAECPFHALR